MYIHVFFNFLTMQIVNHIFMFLCLPMVQFSYSQLLRTFGLIVDEKIENCAPPDQDAKAFDLSKYEFIAVTDYEGYVNGSVKFLRKIDGKIPFHVYTEKFDRGQWHMSVYNAVREDFCSSWHDPKEAWYTKMKRHKGCPLEIGVKITKI